jgi:activating signal cointegrator 1
MKVITLKQPWAELVKKGIKRIETRSWKTNYRGELYIHASKSKINKKQLINSEILNLFNIDDCDYGAITIKCKLIDCIYMDCNFINKIKKNKKEYSSGIYEVGRYAWILDDIELIDPVYTNGQLGIWNY